MKIAIIGATGMAGHAVFHEAVTRGHEVTAIVRDGARARQLLGNDVSLLAKDAFELQKSDLADFDVVINAFSAPPAKAYLHVDLAAKLTALFRETQRPRLFFVLGAGSLLDENDRPFVETIRRQPGSDAWITIPEAQSRELTFLRGVDNVNWVGVSPSALFQEGERHAPKLGRDHLLKAADGTSHVTNATIAAAILDEIEHPTVKNSRFTVSD
ncbi:NAD(P)-dependent oxidoreductase [Sporolactobacillus sp. KGMB 08714]|uniref:NAD(P)-dependent oxidoreductase n=1 Tax=Sporolactobacillus sp. KGMB 08714 TaxID=3064704 RepID=UPI002FBEF02E